MIINSSSKDFKPSGFEIVDFYGSETCFAWENEKLVIFPYKQESTTPALPIIIAPRPIKRIHSYSGRVFLVCQPSGIYKLKKNYSFGMLSAAAIETVTDFHEVLTPHDSYLYFGDKYKKTSTQMFKLTNPNNNLQLLLLKSEKMHDNLQSAFNNDNSTICILAHDKNLFKLHNGNTQMLYTSLWDITQIIKINKNDKIFSFLLKTTCDVVVLVYAENSKLLFKNIHCNNLKNCITAGFYDNSDDNLWIAYSNEQKVIYMKQNLQSKSPEIIDSKPQQIVYMRDYNNKILALTNNAELIELVFNTAEKKENKSEELPELQEGMLNGTEIIVEQIYDKAKQLKRLNEHLLIMRNKLERINIFAHQTKIRELPKFEVHRVGGLVFFKANFGDTMPKNTWIYINLMCKSQTIFSSKIVQDPQTIIEIQVDPELIDSTLNISVDLITFIEEDKPWGIIQNCTKTIKRYGNESHEKMMKKRDFIHSKLNTLRKMVEDNNIDMNKLISIKKSIRRDIPDV